MIDNSGKQTGSTAKQTRFDPFPPQAAVSGQFFGGSLTEVSALGLPKQFIGDVGPHPFLNGIGIAVQQTHFEKSIRQQLKLNFISNCRLGQLAQDGNGLEGICKKQPRFLRGKLTVFFQYGEFFINNY